MMQQGIQGQKKQQSDLAIEAHGLVKVFGDNRAVDGVDLSIPTGSIYALLGPNGAGKTTIINVLTTLLKPDGGSAKIFGHDVAKETQVVRQLISVTGQSAAVDERLSATENLTIFGMLLGLSRSQASKRAAELLVEFGLEDAAKRTLEKFSGGMRRRLDLASSLITQAPLVFLDEPTTGLDPRTRIQMWESIRRMVASGSTILLTTQYLDEADQLADRIAVIDHGRVVAEGTPRELKAAVGKATLNLSLADEKEAPEAARIAELEGRLAKGGSVSFKVSEKGGVSVYGLGRFPVTLYLEQWDALLSRASELREFIEANKSRLKTKDQTKR